jgi:hypothetical protein
MRRKPLAVDANRVEEQVVVPRAKRYVSHALVEVRRFKWLPFFCHSAVLLAASNSDSPARYKPLLVISIGSISRFLRLAFQLRKG